MRPPPRSRPPLLRAALVAACAVAGACQPVDAPLAGPAPTPSPVASVPLGMPVEGAPADLDGLLAQAGDAARQWQDEPVVVEVLVEVAPGAAAGAAAAGAPDPSPGEAAAASATWTAAAVTYLAADADRLFTFLLGSDGVTQQRPTLATLGLVEVSQDGIAAVPPWPEGAREPADLVAAARPVLGGCGVRGEPSAVLYATGAPVSWDGLRWSAPPAWTVTVTAGDQGGVRLDPVTGEPLPEPCVAAAGG